MSNLRVWGRSELDKLKRDVDRHFDSLCLDLGLPRIPSTGPFELNLSEEDNHFVLTAHLPGCTADDVDVSVTSHRLTIQARQLEQFPGGSRATSMRREVGLPCPVRPDQVEAVFSEDRLTIRLPKCPPARRGIVRITLE